MLSFAFVFFLPLFLVGFISSLPPTCLCCCCCFSIKVVAFTWYPTMANIRVVSSLGDVATELQNLHITDIAQVNNVRFQLDEQAPLQDAANMKMKIRPGKHGFILVNPEPLECKYCAKMALETSFNRMLKASMEWIDQELQPIEAGIAALRVLVGYNDQQIPPNGPPLNHRNRGVQHCIYTCPPVRVSCSLLFWDKDHFKPVLSRSYEIRLPPVGNVSITIRCLERIMQVLCSLVLS